MQFTTIVAICALAAVAVAVDKEFTAQFKGECKVNGEKYVCRGKGPSQADQFSVTSSDAVDFEVTPLLGSYALLSCSGTMSGSEVKETGNLTFGTHQAREHTIFYESNGGVTLPLESDEIAYTISATITGGEGALKGAKGVLSVSGYSNKDFTSFTSYISVVTNVDL